MAEPSSASECVKVAIRCRPMSSNENKEGYQDIIHMDPSKGEVYIKEQDQDKPRLFTFDFAFDKTSTQKSVFERSAKEIVDFVIKGYNGTIFAYGQTGTGKTHTMQGGSSESDWGITPRSFRRVFEVIRASEKVQYLVSASMYELYNEEVNDLLNREGVNLKIKENPQKGFYIQDLDTKEVKDEQELMKIMEIGNQNRKTSSTMMNERSSRSHCIFVVTVDSKTVTENGAECYTSGKLNLVDLAGSEKQKKTQVSSNIQREEAIKINLSLTTLRKCISELVKGAGGHVSFRDSNLTKLLKDSLGGNTKTFMIANIGPASYNTEESLSTLKYAYGAKSIKNKPKVNEDPKDSMIRKYNDEIEQLRLQLAAASSGTQLDPKALMTLLGNTGASTGSNDKMAEIIAQRQLELDRQKQDIEAKRHEIEELRKKRLSNGENAERVEKELNAMEQEIVKQEVAIETENFQKAKLLDDLTNLEQKLVVGDKEREKVDAKKQELDTYKSMIQGNTAQLEALQDILKQKQTKKDQVDRTFKDMQSQITQIDKEMNTRNLELTKINAEINSFEEVATMDKQNLLKEIAYLNQEQVRLQRVISALIPHSVEQVLTSLVEWDESAQNWSMVKNQKIQPRYERPFSIHGLKKPTMSLPGCRPEYQNAFLKPASKQGLEFWRDRFRDTEVVLKGDTYIDAQVLQAGFEDLAVNEMDTKELDELDKLIQEREQREAEEMQRKARELEDEPAKQTNTSATDRTAISKTSKAKTDVPVDEEELFPEARGKKGKRA